MSLAITRDLVLKKLRDCFRHPTDAKAALASLEHYGNRKSHVHANLVHLAILKLSDGKLWQLRDYVKIARKDFRDVLVLAETPEEARLTKETYPLLRRGLPTKRLSRAKEIMMQKRDQAQWKAWLTSTGR